MVRPFWRLSRVPFLFALLALCAPFSAFPESEIPQQTGIVTCAEWFRRDTSTVQEIEARCRRMERATSVEIAILVLESTRPHSTEEYAQRAFSRWTFKNRGNGILLLVALFEEDMRIITGPAVGKRIRPWMVEQMRNRIIYDVYHEFDLPKLHNLGYSKWGQGIIDALLRIEFLLTGKIVSPLIPENSESRAIVKDPFPPGQLKLTMGYIALVIFSCAVGWHILRSRDPTVSAAHHKVAQHLDPFEVAYLRGGPSESFILAVFDLIRRGFLSIVGEPGQMIRCVRTGEPGNPRHLPEIDRRVFEWFETSRTAREIRDTIPASVVEFFVEYRDRLVMERYLMPPKERVIGYFIKGATLSVPAVGFLYLVGRLSHALSFFAVMILFCGIVVALKLFDIPRLTRRGSHYLKEGSRAFELAQQQIGENSPSTDDETVLYSVAFFGIGTLRGTKYNSFPEMFRLIYTGGGYDPEYPTGHDLES